MNLLRKRFPDAKRFVEFWATYANPAQGSLKVAVPLLAEYLHEFEDNVSLANLKRLRPVELRYFPEELDGVVAIGDTVDASLVEVESACPLLSRREIRKWSYPAVFYREVRSGFVHELNPTPSSSHIPADTSGSAVTYRNCVSRPFRRIHFAVDWLCEVVEGMAERVYLDWLRGGARCGRAWWLDGA